MRHIISRTFFLTILLTASTLVLHAQDSDDLVAGGDQPGLLVDGMPGIGNLLPLEELLSSDEDLATETGPAPGDIPVDGGLSLLLAAGAAFGANRLRTRYRRRNEEMHDRMEKPNGS